MSHCEMYLHFITIFFNSRGEKYNLYLSKIYVVQDITTVSFIKQNPIIPLMKLHEWMYTISSQNANIYSSILMNQKKALHRTQYIYIYC